MASRFAEVSETKINVRFCGPSTTGDGMAKKGTPQARSSKLEADDVPAVSGATPSGPPTPRSAATVNDSVKKVLAWASVAKWGLFCVCLPASIWALQFVAKPLAGQDTKIDVAVTASITIALTITTAGGAVFGYRKQKSDRASRKRIVALEAKIVSLNNEIEAKASRISGLETDLAGVRGDIARLRTSRKSS